MRVNSKHLAFRESKAAVPALGLRVYMLVFCQWFCILPVKHLCLMDQQTGTGSVISICVDVHLPSLQQQILKDFPWPSKVNCSVS